MAAMHAERGRHARGLLGLLDGGLAKLFGINSKLKQDPTPQYTAAAAAATAATVPAPAVKTIAQVSSSSSPHAGLASTPMGQPASSSATADWQSQFASAPRAGNMAQQQQQHKVAAHPAAQRPNTWPGTADDAAAAATAAAAAAYVHSWEPESTPAAASEGMLKPPAQALMQAPLQPLAMLTTDPKDHTGPHPWDVLLFKTTQFNTTRPAYRLGGLGLMLMTDFNQSKPLTDWHFLGSDTHSQQHSMQPVGSRPAAAPKTVPFVEGASLVKGGLAQVQQPARPYAGLASQQHPARGAPSAAGGMHSQQQQPQQQQQMLARQQKHAQRAQQRGSAVGIASVGGGDSSSSSRGSGSSLSAGPQAPGDSAGSSAPQAGAGAPAAGGFMGFKPESMVALLKTALQRNMRMSAPGTQPGQQADSSSSSSTASNSSVGGSEWGGISTVTMEPVHMWCIACQEPAYLLATAGYCGKHCCEVNSQADSALAYNVHMLPGRCPFEDQDAPHAAAL
jgi:hypothetical protein